MTQGLLELFKHSLGEDLVMQIARRLGEPEEPMRLAMDGLLPVLLGCMAQRGASVEGAQSLMRTIASVPLDPGMLAAPARLLTEDTGTLERLTTMGPGMLGFLIGNQANRLAGAVASVSGIRVSSASWLVAFITALVCAVMNRAVQTNKLDASGVQALLLAQREALQASLDRRVLAALGKSGLNDYVAGEDRGAGGASASAEPLAPVNMPANRKSMQIPASIMWSGLAVAGLLVVWWLLRG
ncbi:MAG: DUF937 domain-containing protein [Burkholderiales bacterium]